MTASAQLKQITDRESQGICRQDELIGGKPPVGKYVWFWEFIWKSE
jgi:hypothetical protein